MRVLLTGHKGYIGAVASGLLRSAGHEVVGYDSDLFETCDFGALGLAIPEIHKDLRDLSPTDLLGFDAVLHYGAISNDPMGNLDKNLTYDVNHHATVHLAKLAKAAGVKRFVFSSSCSTYGAAGDDLLDETAALNPVTAYGESKVFAERDISPMADDNFSPVFMRNATAYGVSPRLRLDIVLNDFVAAAHANGEIHIKSDGTPWRPIVHIRDIIGAAMTMLDAPREAMHNQRFNVGRTDQNYRISELADIVKDTVPGCKITYAADGGPDKRCYRVTCEKIRKMVPSFVPKWDARQGAKELYEAYKTIQLTKNDLTAGKYIRMSQIRRLLDSGMLDDTLRWVPATRGK